MLRIPLTKGKETLIDECDADLAVYKWTYGDRTTPGAKKKRYNEESGYAKRVISINGVWKTVRLHRIIMERILGNPIPEGYIVDHRSTNPLDNRRENLRLATPTQNARNAVKEGNHTNPYKGVSYSNEGRRIKRWSAQIFVNSKKMNLGRFHTPEEAALVYNEAALKYYGEFARLNVVDWL